MELEPGSYNLVSFFNGEKVGDPLAIEVKPAPAEQLLKDPLKAGADKKAPPGKDDKTPPPGAPPPVDPKKPTPKGGH